MPIGIVCFVLFGCLRLWIYSVLGVGGLGVIGFVVIGFVLWLLCVGWDVLVWVWIVGYLGFWVCVHYFGGFGG